MMENASRDGTRDARLPRANLLRTCGAITSAMFVRFVKLYFGVVVPMPCRSPATIVSGKVLAAGAFDF